MRENRTDENSVAASINLRNDQRIFVWKRGYIQIPSSTMNLEDACEMVGALQKAIEKLRSMKDE